MRKGDKGKKVFGAIVILAIIVSVFGGAVSAEDLSGGGLKRSVVDKAPSKDNTISDEEYVVVSAEDVSEDFTGSVADTKIQAAFAEDKIQSLSSQTEIFVGQGFDKCEIPTLSQMQNWITNSPYGAVNLYIGGSCRSCPNSALTASYVSQLSQQGWKFIPTWVGPQSPCAYYKKNDHCYSLCPSHKISYDSQTAYQQGVDEANAAVEIAYQLGLTLSDKTGTIIYYDLEGYDTSCSQCTSQQMSTNREAMKSFINGWVAQLHARGNLAGVYGSACSSHISDFATISNIPDAVWAAHWLTPYQYRPDATVWDVKCLSNSLWANHQRIRQYAGGHGETWGGVTLNIDSNVIDGIVASVGPADIIPLTGDMYGNGKDITGFYNANTVEFTFGGETARFEQMADKTIMSESGTDTTGTYSASKAGFSFDGKTDDTVNNKFTDQGAELGVLSSRSSYDRQAAYNYAMQWWNSCNHECGYYKSCTPWSYWGWECDCGYPEPPHDNGGDCANFVSQCLIAGGHPYLNTGDPCRGYPCGKEEIGAKKLGNCLVSMGWERTCGYHASPPSNIDVGDVLIYHKSSCDGGIAHATIVTSVSGSDVRITCHSVNRKNEPYTYMSTSHPYYEWLHYPSQPTIYPLTGDMNGNGRDSTGTFNTGTAKFKFDGKTVRFGQTNDEPIIGDWDGDGFDEIGVFRPSASMFYLVTRNWADLPDVSEGGVGAADKDVPFDYPEDIPIAGDWDGDGDDDIGGYYPGTFTFYLYLLNLETPTPTATWYCNVCFGDPGDIPLIGDWDNDGDDDVAVCRKNDIAFEGNPAYYFDLDLTGVDPEISPCKWGDNDDIPITGRWNAGSGDKIGVYRPSTEGFIRNYDIPQIQECDGTDTSCGIYPNCENCNNYDGWVDTGNMRWEDVNECKEKEQKEQKYRNYYCAGTACTYGVTGTQWVDTGNTKNKPDGTDCGSDGWVDTGTTRWVDDPENECKEKEQKEQEYHDYMCSDGTCTYSVTDTQWVDTGNTMEKPDSGVFRNGRWILRSCNPSGAVLYSFKFGRSTDIPVTGDWDGDGVDTIGVRRGKQWILRNSNSAGPPDYRFRFGRSTDIPVTGDWNGDGVDTIGVRRGKQWLLRNSNSAGPPDYRFRFGRSTDIPVTGDWNGDGIDTIGVRRGKQWILRDSNSAGSPDYRFRFGRSTDIPVTGDWNGDGIDTIGVRRGKQWILRDSNSAGSPDYRFKFGRSTDIPVTGNWDRA